MKKLLGLLILGLLVLPSVLAINITLDKQDAMDVVVSGIDAPAKFTYNITNNGEDDEFFFFNLFGFTLSPDELVSIDSDQTKTVEIIVWPRKDLAVRGYYTFPIYIRGKDDSEIEKKLTIKILDLKDCFEVGSSDFDPESNSMSFYIQNLENFEYKDLTAVFKSKFFEQEETFDLKPLEKKDFTVELDKEDFKQLTAGFYTLETKISVEDLEADIEGIIKFVEKDIVEETTKDYGIIINTKIIKKINNGNKIQESQTIISKNIISRLFTTFSLEPNEVKREGAKITYVWNQEINPGETEEIVVKTNWLFPLIILAFLAIILFFVYQFTNTDVILRKRVSFVKAKGGEFALKVTLFAHSKKYVERVNIVDRLPSLMKIYNRFGGEQPSKVNEKTGLIEWNFEKLEEGETRTLTYIVYSKNVGVMGKFALPAAAVIYQKDGKIHESQSNKTFFVAEPKKDLDFK